MLECWIPGDPMRKASISGTPELLSTQRWLLGFWQTGHQAVVRPAIVP